MKTRHIALCSALLSIATLPALAEDTNSGSEKKDMFASLDADADGQLTKEEVASHSGLADSFSMIDRNSDGYISKGEFRRNVRSKPADR